MSFSFSLFSVLNYLEDGSKNKLWVTNKKIGRAWTQNVKYKTLSQWYFLSQSIASVMCQTQGENGAVWYYLAIDECCKQ